MGSRSQTTFVKLQKERARQEKQRAKAERKLERKSRGPVADEETAPAEMMPTQEGTLDSGPATSPVTLEEQESKGTR